ncbi:MAG: hypothetical protein A2293_11850 [Elusimicrobia bacterium RIFOXYB2_FULL_49_7]|nr:MAG: hypothetical protein A2293_11850 [Elusimicrobia bacterium RIFOXYB2_FULL_49_7]
MNESIRVLVVDDELEIQNSLSEILQEEGYAALCASSAKEAIKRLEEKPDIAFLDIKIGNDNGMALLKEIRDKSPDMPVIMITGHGTVSLAAEAFRFGAQDFLEKPLRLVLVRTALRNAVEKIRLKRNLLGLLTTDQEGPVFAAPSMKELYDRAARLSGLKEPVMILGPSGSGKELVARFLHFKGVRAGNPFVAMNASALPEKLAEDELFGHEKGAFTGADSRREGKLFSAEGGTLFLDEIGDMDMNIQTKLLRYLETGEYCRLGSDKPLKSDVRFLCATHQNLDKLIQEGKFREDLYYRLNAFVLKVPPLSERREDIPLLCERFLKNLSLSLGSDKRLSDGALTLLIQHDFPGNVRELKNILTRAAVYCDRTVIGQEVVGDVLSELPKSQHTDKPLSEGELDFRSARIEFERHFIQQALTRFGNNISMTAQHIGIAQPNLSRKMKELGIR